MKKLFGGKKSKAVNTTAPSRVGDGPSRPFEPPRHSIQEPRRYSQPQELPRHSFHESSRRQHSSHHFDPSVPSYNVDGFGYLDQPLESNPNINPEDYSEPQENEVNDDIAQPGDEGSSQPVVRDRKRKKTSGVWFWFEIGEPGRVVCKQCRQDYAYQKGGGTGTLKRHLNNKHPGWDECEPSATGQSQIYQNEEGMMSNWRYSQENMRLGLSRLVVQNELPFTYAENEHIARFNQMCLQPAYKSVSRNTCYSDGYKQYVAEILNLTEIFQNLKCKVSFTSDMWLGRGSLHYLCITAHWIDDNFCLQKRIIEFQQLDHPHTGLHIYEAIVQCFRHWKLIEKVMCISFDNASNNTRAVEELKLLLNPMDDGIFFHVRCFCHILHLCIKYGLEVINNSIAKIRSALTHITASSVRLQEYRLLCEIRRKKYLAPYLDVQHRWNSTYMMLRRAIPYRDIINEFVNRAMTDEDGNPFLTETDWKIAKKLSPILQKFNEKTKIMSGHFYPTANLLLPTLYEISDIFNKYRNDEELAAVINKMEEKWIKYYERIPDIAIIAGVLDPRCKFEFCVNIIKEYHKNMSKEEFDHKIEEKRILDMIKRMYRNYNQHTRPRRHEDDAGTSQGASSSRGGLFKSMMHLRSTRPSTTSSNEGSAELALYLFEQPCEDDYPNFNILEWWSNNSKAFPTLSMIARDIFAAQMSTVASESAFSAGRRTLTDTRARLKPDSIRFCILWKDWLDQEYRSKCLRKTKTIIEEFEEDDEEWLENETTNTSVESESSLDNLHEWPVYHWAHLDGIE